MDPTTNVVPFTSGKFDDTEDFIRVRPGIAVFVAVVQFILFIGHAVVYGTWIQLWGAPNASALVWLRLTFAILSVSFVAMSILAFWFSNPFVRVFEFLSLRRVSLVDYIRAGPDGGLAGERPGHCRSVLRHRCNCQYLRDHQRRPRSHQAHPCQAAESSAVLAGTRSGVRQRHASWPCTQLWIQPSNSHDGFGSSA